MQSPTSVEDTVLTVTHYYTHTDTVVVTQRITHDTYSSRAVSHKCWRHSIDCNTLLHTQRHSCGYTENNTQHIQLTCVQLTCSPTSFEDTVLTVTHYYTHRDTVVVTQRITHNTYSSPAVSHKCWRHSIDCNTLLHTQRHSCGYTENNTQHIQLTCSLPQVLKTQYWL